MDYDLIIVGGGLGGSALAKGMAEIGAKVLVVEQERQFRDRVRGEGMHPWGVAEARKLGIYEPLLSSCGHEVRWWASSPNPQGGANPARRDLIETTVHHAGELTFYHPAMQAEMIRIAEAAGAEILRGATVSGVIPGVNPTVVIEHDDVDEHRSARLVIGADGRRSRVRQWAGFIAVRDPDHLLITGVLLDRMPIDDDAVHNFRPSTFGSRALLFPLGGDRVRAYFITGRRTEHMRVSGEAQLPQMIRYCIDAGVPKNWFEGVKIAGPLATFEGADVWVEHPYRDGVVLVGDAAGASDPSWGCGLSLTLRDVRVLRDLLIENEEWDTAAHMYADEHDRYFAALHTAEFWMTRILYDLGAEADAVRVYALPKLVQGCGPDFAGLGPESPVDETARIALFGS